MSEPYRILIGTPSYGGGIQNLAPHIWATEERGDWKIDHLEATSSLLTWTFNTLWAYALNARARGVTHFLMLHSDVRPSTKDWLRVMMREMERSGAQVLSAIIPIKSQGGLTSTAFDTDPWRPRKLSLREAAELPDETWSAEGLLVNTGLMLVDFRGDWVEKICFTINDRIRQAKDGTWIAEVEPEDWNFSRQCRALGIRLYVTRAVMLEHYGQQRWTNEATKLGVLSL